MPIEMQTANDFCLSFPCCGQFLQRYDASPSARHAEDWVEQAYAVEAYAADNQMGQTQLEQKTSAGDGGINRLMSSSRGSVEYKMDEVFIPSVYHSLSC
jgi:hypothetical protein